MKTEQLSLSHLQEVVLKMPADAMSDRRAAAIASLRQGQLPTTRDEDWKYTDLSEAIRISNSWLQDGKRQQTSDTSDAAIADIRNIVDADWIVISNGQIDASAVQASNSVSIESFSQTLPEGVAATPLEQLNAALLIDGLRIQVHAATERPLGLLIVDDSSHGVNVSQVNVIIDVADGCEAEVVEYHTSVGDEDNYCNAFATLTAGASSRVAWVRIQERQLNHMQTSHFSAVLGDDSTLQMSGFDLGGKFVRNDVVIDLCNPRTNVTFDGLYLAGDGQHIDNHTRVDHRVGPTESYQEYRGILRGNSRCVWNGKAVVHEGADGTNANQANHNLLLSERAEINTKPELEIYADEVKCSHGTTVGQLDNNALYYLRTRGIDEDQARRLLTQAFAAKIAQQIPVDDLRETLRNRVETRLHQLLQES